MRRVLAWIVLAPIAGIAVIFAVANRRWVTVSFDPFSPEAPAYAAEMPMFLLIFIALIVGVLIGGLAVWFGKVRWQMAAHRAEREVARLRAEREEAERRAQDAQAATGPLSGHLPPP